MYVEKVRLVNSKLGRCGSTALLVLAQASRFGHLDVVDLLLEDGADTNVADRNGNLAAHIAAIRGHLHVLAALLQSRTPPNIDLANDQGVTVRDLAARAMDSGDEPSDDDVR